MSANVVIVGATSAIAASFARERARRGDRLHLLARDDDELKRISADLQTRYNVRVTSSQIDACDATTYAEAFQTSLLSLGSIDGIFFALGHLGDQSEAEQEPLAAEQIAMVNYLSAVSFLTICAKHLEKQKKGFIVAVSSVAGDRGRPSNYVYGSSKGALSLFVQGLRARMFKHGVHVMTVKPGFVDTKMTFGKEGMFLVADPDAVGKSIARALDAKKDVIYVPAFWGLIMLIIRSIPEPVFKRMKL